MASPIEAVYEKYKHRDDEGNDRFIVRTQAERDMWSAIKAELALREKAAKLDAELPWPPVGDTETDYRQHALRTVDCWCQPVVARSDDFGPLWVHTTRERNDEVHPEYGNS